MITNLLNPRERNLRRSIFLVLLEKEGDPKFLNGRDIKELVEKTEFIASTYEEEMVEEMGE